jgi:hypothetical protein
MTDSIDLDDLDVSDDDDEGASSNRGDWFWRGTGDPDDHPDPPSEHDGGGSGSVDSDAGRDPGVDDPTPDVAETDDGAASSDAQDGDPGGPIPRVPRENEGKPVGIPVEGGGAGGADAKRANERERERTLTDDPEAGNPEHPDPPADSGGTAGAGGASGPHGGGVDDMTLAFTYEALGRLVHLQSALADANTWSDWIGIVGDVPAHVITTFQRTEGVDADFFNGAGAGPAERLADVDRTSMFFAERMVVVGLPRESWIAEEAGWEFVPLADAAEGAGWELEPADGEDG